MKRLAYIVCAVVILGLTVFLTSLQLKVDRLKSRVGEFESRQLTNHRNQLIERTIELRLEITSMKFRGVPWRDDYQRDYELIRNQAMDLGFTNETAWSKLEAAVVEVGGKP